MQHILIIDATYLTFCLRSDLLQCTLTEVGNNKNHVMAEHADKPKEQHVDPWTAVAAEGENTIDYDKLISVYSINLNSVQVI